MSSFGDSTKINNTNRNHQESLDAKDTRVIKDDQFLFFLYVLIVMMNGFCEFSTAELISDKFVISKRIINLLKVQQRFIKHISGIIKKILIHYCYNEGYNGEKLSSLFLKL